MPVYLITREYQVCVSAESLDEAEALTDATMSQAIDDGRAHVCRSDAASVDSVSQVNDDLLDESPISSDPVHQSTRDILRHG